MNLEKFTERSRGFLQAAQTIATRDSHQKLSPEHLLKALLDDDQGLASNLISHAGGAVGQVSETLALVIEKLPKVTGDAQPFMDTALVKVLAEAEALAKKAGDQFVPVERLLMALCMVKTKAKDALDAGGISAQKLNTAINSLRKGRTADSAPPAGNRTTASACDRVPHSSRCGGHPFRPDALRRDEWGTRLHALAVVLSLGAGNQTTASATNL